MTGRGSADTGVLLRVTVRGFEGGGPLLVERVAVFGAVTQSPMRCRLFGAEWVTEDGAGRTAGVTTPLPLTDEVGT